MLVHIRFFVLLLALSNLLGGCKQEKKPQGDLLYDSIITMEDTSPFGEVQARLVVSPRFKHQTAQEVAVLYALSNYQRVREQEKSVSLATERVPFDTVRVALRPGQMDTIYQLARAIFQLPAKPPRAVEDGEHSRAHDLDNYMRVSFRPQAWTGPTFECIGYREANAATYALYVHLSGLKEQVMRRRK